MLEDKTSSISPSVSGLSYLIGFFASQIAVYVLYIIASIIVSLSTGSYSADTLSQSAPFYLLATLFMDGVLVIIYFICRKKYLKSGKILENDNKISKFSIKRAFLYVAFGILSLFMLLPAVSCFDYLLIKFNANPNSFPYELNGINYFISIFSLVIIPAIAEEMLFRGVIIRGLYPFGKTASIILTSVMFSFFHMSINQIFYPLLFGLLLSSIMYKENSIIYTILVHAVNNFISLTLSYFNITLFVANTWYYILAIILLIVFVILTTFFIKKIKSNDTKCIRFNIKSTSSIVFVSSISIIAIIWAIQIGMSL